MKRFLLFSLVLIFSGVANGYAIPSNLRIHGTKATLHKILDIIERKEKGVYLRFGDGDVVIANGKSSNSHPNPTPEFVTELRQAFALNGPNVLKTLPLYCKENIGHARGGWEPGMFHMNHQESLAQAINMLSLSEPFWGNEITDVYSHVALCFAATQYPSFCCRFLKELKASAPIIFVGNHNTSKKARDILFGEDCPFIRTPSKNAHFEIDRIEEEVLREVEQVKGYKVIVVAMGNSGRALNKRLWYKLDNVFLFDFGSLLDALDGNKSRAWIGLTKFNGSRFLDTLKKNGL